MIGRMLAAALLAAALLAPALGAPPAWANADEPADGWGAKSPEFRQGVAALATSDYRAALAAFEHAASADPKDADAANYLGFTHRKLGDYDVAIRFYKQALALNPKHLGAYEYLGEAYLELKDLAQAKQQLAKLNDLCWLGCKEYTDLKRAVAAYESKGRK